MSLRKVNNIVHCIGYFSHNRGTYVCGIAFEPKWGSDDDRKTEDPEIYVDDENRLCTHNKLKTTCKGCLAKL